MSKIKSEDCVKFINENLDDVQSGLKWKRLSKKNDSDKNPIREFESSNGDIVTVKEDKSTGELSIIKVEKSDNIEKSTTKDKPKHKPNDSVDLELVIAKGSFVNKVLENKDNIIKKVNAQRDKVIKMNPLCLKDLRDKSAFYGDEFNNEDSVLNRLMSVLLYAQAGYFYGVNQRFNDVWYTMEKEYGVMFDLENFELTKETFTHKGKDFEAYVGYAGGDWEFPVYFAVYWDVQKNMPVFYVPHDKFNLFSREFKTAYGSEMNSGLINYNFNSSSDDSSDEDGESIDLLDMDYGDMEYPSNINTLVVKSLKSHLIQKARNPIKLTEDEPSEEKTPFDFLVKNIEIADFMLSEYNNLSFEANKSLIGKISGSVEKDKDMLISQNAKELMNIHKKIKNKETKNIWNGLLQPLIGIQADISNKGLYNGLMTEYGVAFKWSELNLETFKISLKSDDFIEVMFGTVCSKDSVPLNVLVYIDSATFLPKFYISLTANDFNKKLNIAYGAEESFGYKSELSQEDIQIKRNEAINDFDVNSPKISEITKKMKVVIDELLNKMNNSQNIKLIDENNKKRPKP